MGHKEGVDMTRKALMELVSEARDRAELFEEYANGNSEPWEPRIHYGMTASLLKDLAMELEDLTERFEDRN